MTDKAPAGGPKARRGFHHYLSPEAYAGWTDVSVKYGVSMTALVEVVGLIFASTGDRFTVEEVEQALQVDRDRRARRRD